MMDSWDRTHSAATTQHSEKNDAMPCRLSIRTSPSFIYPKNLIFRYQSKSGWQYIVSLCFIIHKYMYICNYVYVCIMCVYIYIFMYICIYIYDPHQIIHDDKLRNFAITTKSLTMYQFTIPIVKPSRITRSGTHQRYRFIWTLRQPVAISLTSGATPCTPLQFSIVIEHAKM